MKPLLLILLMELFFILGLAVMGLIDANRQDVIINKIIDNSSEHLLGLWTNNDPLLWSSTEWIHINVNEMNYERCIIVSQHECGHSLYHREYPDYDGNKTSEEFAGKCDIGDYCLNLSKELGK